MPRGRRMIEEIRPKPNVTLKPLTDPDCCEMGITGCIHQDDVVMTAIERRTDLTSNLSVQASPSVQVNSDAHAESNAAASVDASAVAPPTPGTPASSSDAQAIPDSKADPHADAVASTVTDSKQSQTMVKEQAMVMVAVKYHVDYHVCNSHGCVRVSGEVRDANNTPVYNFQRAEASGAVHFVTLGVYETTQPLPRGVLTLKLKAVDQCHHSASFDDTSPEVVQVN